MFIFTCRKTSEVLRASNYPDLLLELPKYAVQLKFSISFFSFMETCPKFYRELSAVWSTVYSAGIVIDTVLIENLLAPFCGVFGTLWHFMALFPAWWSCSCKFQAYFY